MSGTTHRLNFHEGPDQIGTEDEIVGDGPILRRKYVVLKEIFKRGRLWKVGEPIDLDPTSGAAFAALGEVEEIDTDEEKSTE